MNIFDSLRRDHKELLSLLIKLQSTSKRSVKERQKLFSQLKDFSELHLRLEEAYFYSPLMRWREMHDLISISTQQHESAQQLLLELSTSEISEKEWERKLSWLQESYRKYIEEEEATLFEEAEHYLDNETSIELGRQMLEERKDFVFSS
jgi:hypothetical protein